MNTLEFIKRVQGESRTWFESRTEDGSFTLKKSGYYIGIPDWIESEQEKDRGIFFTPDVLNGKERNSDNAISFNSCFIDLDNAPIPGKFILEPSVIISRQDKRGHHLYWLLSAPSADKKRWKDTQKKIVYTYPGSDLSIVSAGHLMRLPGTWNKKKEKYDQTFEIKVYNPHITYTLEELFEAHKDENEIKAKHRKEAVKKYLNEWPYKNGDQREPVIFNYGLFLTRKKSFNTLTVIEHELEKINTSYIHEVPRAVIEQKALSIFAQVARIEAAEVEENEHIKNDMKSHLEDWYYVYAQDIFINSKRPKQYRTREGFNHNFASIAQKGSASMFVAVNNLIKSVESLAYEPAEPRIIDIDELPYFNTWTPSSLMPIDAHPDWFIAHLEYLIPVKEEREHMLNYIAYIIQTNKKVLHAIVMIGPEGTGKSFVGRTLRKIVGPQNYKEPRNSSLHENYTGWAKDCQIVWINELKQGDRYELAEKLKPFITEPTIEIREMHRMPYEITNHMNIIAASNHDIPVFLTEGERRYFITETTHEKKPPEYYIDLLEKINTRAGEVMNFLLNRDISDFNPGLAPMITAAKNAIIEYSKSDLEIRIYDMIELCKHPFDIDVVNLTEITDYMRAELRDKYITINRVALILRKLEHIRIDFPIKIEGKKIRLWIIREYDRWKKRIGDETFEKEYLEMKKLQEEKAQTFGQGNH